uniref:protease modulator HflK n=1 Tax=Pseudomonas laurentiana TaxID=2364649 RepID=UPI0029C6C9BA|nr:protease modulator HflK [Pseudomonas laurentiana]
MRVDLDTDKAQLAALPRFQHAALHARHLLIMGLVSGVLISLLLLAALFVDLFAADSIWLPLLCNTAATLLLLAAATQAAWRVAKWRASALQDEPTPGADGSNSNTEQSLAALSPYDRLLEHVSQGSLALLRHIGLSAVWITGLSLLALLCVKGGWRLDLPAAPLGQNASVAVGVALLVAFALLVLERQLSANSSLQWPEAAGLAMLSRVVIASLLIAALCLSFVSAETNWPVRLAVLSGLLPALVALELILRALLSVFSPQRPTIEPQFIAESFIASLLQWPPRPLDSLQDALQQRFGIDLRQVWAFGFMRRAFLPVLTLVALVGWLLSGISEVPMNERGIYERFGKPMEVLNPGLHAGLPWPFGRVRAVENGVIHEVASSSGELSSETATPAEGPAPGSANRMWDASHQSEKSQVIASANDGKQSFQVVNMDVRFVYRIGLSDQAALAATYNSADVPALIRSTASRVLVHNFATRTLDDLLGEERLALAADIGNAVQGDLDRMNSGVELLATVVEAIHPPAGAANAYHGVQAAQIGAKALIARERGTAAETTHQARLQASIISDRANAAAHETQAAAHAAGLRFDAEQRAWRTAGQAFINEQYFSQLGLGLANAKALILDHRIAVQEPPTLDLRTFAAPIDPGKAHP